MACVCEIKCDRAFASRLPLVCVPPSVASPAPSFMASLSRVIFSSSTSSSMRDASSTSSPCAASGCGASGASSGLSDRVLVRAVLDCLCCGVVESTIDVSSATVHESADLEPCGRCNDDAQTYHPRRVMVCRPSRLAVLFAPGWEDLLRLRDLCHEPALLP